MILVAQSSRKHVLTRLFVEVRLHLPQIPDEPAHRSQVPFRGGRTFQARPMGTTITWKIASQM